MVHLLQTKTEFKNLFSQEIQVISTKVILIKLAFNMIWLMVNIKIWLKKQNQIKCSKAFKIATNPNYDGYQRGLFSIIYKHFNKKSAVSGVAMLANKSISNQLQLANEHYKPNIRQSKRRTAYSSIKDSIWGVYLADMQLISKYYKEIRYVPLYFLMNMRRLRLWNTKKVFLLLIRIKVFQTVQNANLTKYGLIKAVNYITVLLLK